MERFEIPAGEECEDCPFKLFENDGPVDLSQCALYGECGHRWTEDYDLKRCSQCLSDHPHGAMVIIQNKEENPVTVKVVIHEAEDELTTHGGPNEAVTMYETFECQMFVPEGEYYLIPKKDEEEP